MGSDSHDHEREREYGIGLLDHPHHDHSHEPPLTSEEPFDPANQSLADALRASFGVLKGLMVLVLILFLLSGIYQVGINEVGVQTRFGAQVGPPTEPGLHFAWPYPIDSITKVYTGQRTVEIDGFWLQLSEADKTRPLTEVSIKTGGLDPATDGALITGDQALMHLLLQVQYYVNDANAFAQNVSDVDNLLRTVVQQSAVAEAARTTADVIWKNPAEMVPGIQSRAQKLLDGLHSGIIIENLTPEKSHYPLQVRDDFIAVQDAENRMGQAIQTANKEREEKLKGAAGPAWEEINRQIERLDQVDGEGQRAEIRERIGELIENEATGTAGEKIQLARGKRDKIIAEATAAVARFETMLAAYQENPKLVTDRLRQETVAKIFEQKLLPVWVLPPGQSKFFLFNTNPAYFRMLEQEQIKKQTGVK